MNQVVSPMEYRKLGNTNLKVSVISYGNWLNSEFPEQIERNVLVIKRCWDLGINFFDTAEIYGHGEAERQLGSALSKLQLPRQDLVITTKIFFGTNPSNPPNSRFLSRKHIVEGLRASLQRLQMEYVDVYYAHRCESNTPMEEICRSFDWCVRKGLCHYWATSEWLPEQIMQAYGICDRLGLMRPICEQPQYNLYVRENVEVGYERLFEMGMGSTVWSPLFQGLLTGKYNEGIDPNGRLGHPEAIKDNGGIKNVLQKYFGSEEGKQKTLNELQQLGEVAKEMGCSQAQLAMAWVIRNRDVSTAITGASREEQIEELVKAVQIYKQITPALEQRINQIFQNKPQPGLDVKSMQFKQSRRDQFINQ